MALTARRRFVTEQTDPDQPDLGSELLQFGSQLRDRAGAQLFQCQEALAQQRARRKCRVDCFGSASLHTTLPGRCENGAGVYAVE